MVEGKIVNLSCDHPTFYYQYHVMIRINEIMYRKWSVEVLTSISLTTMMTLLLYKVKVPRKKGGWRYVPILSSHVLFFSRFLI